MGHFDDPDHVDEYIAMVAGYDGAEFVAVLARYLPAGSSVLELGMGPGTDLDLLLQTYAATGSDLSSVFIDRYREVHPAADLLQLDAVTIDTDRTFDCVYSNKVLIHLTEDELAQSFRRQAEVLAVRGVAEAVTAWAWWAAWWVAYWVPGYMYSETLRLQQSAIGCARAG